MKNLQIFNYENNPISFQIGTEDLMVNATQMAKPFRKKASDFLKSAQIQEFLRQLSELRKIDSSDLVKVIYGNDGGTWMHEDVAMEFARWLNPIFAIWCNDRIKELFHFGLTATEEMLLKAATDPDFVAIVCEELKKSRLLAMELETKRQELTRQIEENAPKVAYYENLQAVKASYDESRTYTVSRIAHSLGIKAGELNILLRQRGIQEKINGSWFLTSLYENCGFAVEREAESKRLNENGEYEIVTVTYLAWTAKGRELIFSLFEKKR